MRGQKKHTKQPQAVMQQPPKKQPPKQQPQKQVKKETITRKQIEDDNKFVNLLHIYSIYKKKLRRLKKNQYQEMLRLGSKGKNVAVEHCKKFMKDKQVPEDVIDFGKNVGFLSVPRLMPIIALLAERARYRLKPCLVKELIFSDTPARFKNKFSQLLVYGFWFLGRVISDSLSDKEQINRGNIFNFSKGDLGFWWAGVRILDWNYYACRESDSGSCYDFVINDPPKYRHFTSRAIINMNQHPAYFLSKEDWDNYLNTIRKVCHVKEQTMVIPSSAFAFPASSDYSDTEYSDLSPFPPLSINSEATIDSDDS